MTTNCPNCGAVVEPAESRCPYCGTTYVRVLTSSWRGTFHPGAVAAIDALCAEVQTHILTPNEARALLGLPPK